MSDFIIQTLKVVDKEINYDELAAIMQSRICGRLLVSQANLISVGFPAFHSQKAGVATHEEEVSDSIRGTGSIRGALGHGHGYGRD
jgi:hypothetical protein